MPENPDPEVFVDENPPPLKPIEGVGTSTTGFVGPARFGPIEGTPTVLRSLADFERIYGDGGKLSFATAGSVDNYVWHAARAFFENGGQLLYVSRIFQPKSPGDEGKASITLTGNGNTTRPVAIRARFPGAAGNFSVRITLHAGANLLGGDAANMNGGSIQSGDIVWLSRTGAAYQAVPDGASWKFVRGDETVLLSDLHPNTDSPSSDQIRPITMAVGISSLDLAQPQQVWTDLSLDPLRSGGVFAPVSITPQNSDPRTRLPILMESADSSMPLRHGLDVLFAIEDTSVTLFNRSLIEKLISADSSDAERSLPVVLVDGNDGERPLARGPRGYEGTGQNTLSGLKAFETVADISIVAAPGSTFGYESGYKTEADSVASLLIAHCEQMQYRISVLDSGDDQSIAQVQAMRAKFNSNCGAIYYPWICIKDPVTQQDIMQPPSGFTAGIFARVDETRGVFKAPSNESVSLAIGLDLLLNQSQQALLTADGVNCFRSFPDRGVLLWGSRTISSDDEWKYVNVRRYLTYLERSIDEGTQWVVFEANGEPLWANVRHSVSEFLSRAWESGGLQGTRPEDAYFVKCDRTTMTQDDLDNGRLICVVGVAPVRPAEFVIFRIGQWTADQPA